MSWSWPSASVAITYPYSHPVNESKMPLSIAPNAIAIDYVVEGPRTAAAVAAGRSRLIGLVIQEADQGPRFVDQDLSGLLGSLGDRQRLYSNALFALAVEAVNDLPPPPTSMISMP